VGVPPRDVLDCSGDLGFEVGTGAEEGKITYARVLERAREWGLEIAGGAVLGCPPLVPEVAWRSSRLSFFGAGIDLTCTILDANFF
jgi:hypothetical protein